MEFELLKSLASPDADTRHRGESYLAQIRQTPAQFCSVMIAGIEQCDALAAERLRAEPGVSLAELFASHQMAFIIMRSTINGRASQGMPEPIDFFYSLSTEQQEVRTEQTFVVT